MSHEYAETFAILRPRMNAFMQISKSDLAYDLATVSSIFPSKKKDHRKLTDERTELRFFCTSSSCQMSQERIPGRKALSCMQGALFHSVLERPSVDFNGEWRRIRRSRTTCGLAWLRSESPLGWSLCPCLHGRGAGWESEGGGG